MLSLGLNYYLGSRINQELDMTKIAKYKLAWLSLIPKPGYLILVTSWRYE